MLQVLKGMSRAERKRLAQDIAEYSGKAATRRQFIRLVRAGKFPKIFTQRQISNAVTERLLESIGSTLDIGGSAWSGMLHVYFTED